VTNSTLVQPPPVEPPADWTFPPVARDGDLVLCHLPGRELAAAAIVLPVPLALEPPGSEGIALAALTCLVDAAPDGGGVVLRDRLEALGASLQVVPSFDGLRLNVTAPAARIPEALERLGDTFAAPRFDLDLVARTLEQRRTAARSLDADPASRAYTELVRQCVQPTSRWASPEGGTVESLTALDAEAIMAMAMRLSQGTPAVLIVSGAIAARGLVRPPGGGDRLVAEVKLRPPAPTRGVVINRPGAVQTCLAVGLAGIDRADSRWADLAAANCVLGGAMWSRLEARLREEKGYTYGVRAGNDPWRRSGLFAVRTSVESVATGPALVDLLTTVGRFGEDGMTPAEYRRATEYLLHSSPLRYETSASVTDQLASLELAGLTSTAVDEVRHRWQDSSADQADAAFRSVVRTDALVVVAVGDAQQIEPALRDAGIQDVEVTA
jgi:predicted Zn-dependent peptidase